MQPPIDLIDQLVLLPRGNDRPKNNRRRQIQPGARQQQLPENPRREHGKLSASERTSTSNYHDFHGPTSREVRFPNSQPQSGGRPEPPYIISRQDARDQLAAIQFLRTATKDNSNPER
jgi:hypothetical protein